MSQKASPGLPWVTTAIVMSLEASPFWSAARLVFSFVVSVPDAWSGAALEHPASVSSAVTASTPTPLRIFIDCSPFRRSARDAG